MKIVRRAAFKAIPWKNGRGVTHEIWRETAGAADPAAFAWRVSMAEVPASGPFSDFSGYYRHLILLQGDGFRLSFPARHPIELRAVGAVAEFDGALPTQCDLLGGACTDLNLMTHAGLAVSVRVEHITESCCTPLTPGATTLLFCIAGSVRLQRDAVSAPALVPAPLPEPAAVLEAWDFAVVEPDGRGGTCQSWNRAPTPALLFVATLNPT